MNYSGTTEANGKHVNVMFNPGWGEPGEWHIAFSGGENGLNIDNVDGVRSQEEYLNMLSADKYRDKIIETNWSTVGNNDDVIRIALEYVGYNDENKTLDLETLRQAGEILREYVKAMTTGIDSLDFSARTFRENSKKFERILQECEYLIETCHDRIRVYDAMKAGNPVGMGWSNESFLRNHATSPMIHRVKTIMQEMEDATP